jgi:hypothetical protein
MTFRTSSTTIVHHSLEDAAHATPPRRSTAAPPGGTENARGMPRAPSLWHGDPTNETPPFPRRRPEGPPGSVPPERGPEGPRRRLCVCGQRRASEPPRSVTKHPHRTQQQAPRPAHFLLDTHRPHPPHHTTPPPPLSSSQPKQLNSRRAASLTSQLNSHDTHQTTPHHTRRAKP